MIGGLNYLQPVLDKLALQWPDNETVNLVCHGHSVPSGYFTTPFVNTFDAYPHLLHRMIKERFPFAVVNVIVTAIGGEHAASGAGRFEKDVLCHNPDVITIDYGLNDRSIGLLKAEEAWKSMIERCLSQQKKVILLTPTWDQSFFVKDKNWEQLCQHRDLIRRLADTYSVGLADSFSQFEQYCTSEDKLTHLLSHQNHPTQKGHQLVAEELSKYFLAR